MTAPVADLTTVTLVHLFSGHRSLCQAVLSPVREIEAQALDAHADRQLRDGRRVLCQGCASSFTHGKGRKGLDGVDETHCGMLTPGLDGGWAPCGRPLSHRGPCADRDGGRVRIQVYAR